MVLLVIAVSWLSRGPDSSGEVWIGCKRLILKLSQVLSVEEVKGPYMPPNQRLILIQKWYDTRDVNWDRSRKVSCLSIGWFAGSMIRDHIALPCNQDHKGAFAQFFCLLQLLYLQLPFHSINQLSLGRGFLPYVKRHLMYKWNSGL